MEISIEVKRKTLEFFPLAKHRKRTMRPKLEEGWRYKIS